MISCFFFLFFFSFKGGRKSDLQINRQFIIWQINILSVTNDDWLIFFFFFFFFFFFKFCYLILELLNHYHSFYSLLSLITFFFLSTWYPNDFFYHSSYCNFFFFFFVHSDFRILIAPLEVLGRNNLRVDSCLHISLGRTLQDKASQRSSSQVRLRLSRPSKKMNTIWEPLIKKAWWKKKLHKWYLMIWVIS